MPGVSVLSLCKDCRSTEYCNRDCQKKHWKSHKSEHFRIIGLMEERRKEAASEAADFPADNFKRYVHASYDDCPEIRAVVIDICKAWVERKLDGVFVFAKTPTAGKDGRKGFSPIRFIGNGAKAHSEQVAYVEKEGIPMIEVESLLNVEQESVARGFLEGHNYEDMELTAELYKKFRAHVSCRGWFHRVGGQKQVDLAATCAISRLHISPVAWDFGHACNMYDKERLSTQPHTLPTPILHQFTEAQEMDLYRMNLREHRAVAVAAGRGLLKRAGRIETSGVGGLFGLDKDVFWHILHFFGEPQPKQGEIIRGTISKHRQWCCCSNYNDAEHIVPFFSEYDMYRPCPECKNKDLGEDPTLFEWHCYLCQETDCYTGLSQEPIFPWMPCGACGKTKEEIDQPEGSRFVMEAQAAYLPYHLWMRQLRPAIVSELATMADKSYRPDPEGFSLKWFHECVTFFERSWVQENPGFRPHAIYETSPEGRELRILLRGIRENIVEGLGVWPVAPAVKVVGHQGIGKLHGGGATHMDIVWAPAIPSKACRTGNGAMSHGPVHNGIDPREIYRDDGDQTLNFQEFLLWTCRVGGRGGLNFNTKWVAQQEPEAYVPMEWCGKPIMWEEQVSGGFYNWHWMRNSTPEQRAASRANMRVCAKCFKLPTVTAGGGGKAELLLLKCPCQHILYCSTECQSKDWALHRKSPEHKAFKKANQRKK
jgi:hypothetical protein